MLKYFDRKNNDPSLILENNVIDVNKKRPKTQKDKHRKRSETATKELSYSSVKFPYDHPLADKASSKLRVSMDHLTFKQIKIERIRQEREVDTAQK